MKVKQVMAAAALAVVTSIPAFAQGTDGTGAVIAVQGGGFNVGTSLDQAGNTDFKPGFNVGGSAGYQFNPFVALRGSVNFVRAEGRDAAFPPSANIDQVQLNRLYYGGDVQFRAPLGGVTPYLFVGGGAVTIKPDTSGDQASFTKPAGKVGAGLTLGIPRSNAAIFAEATGWIYKWDQYGFDKTQFDLTWSAGVSYRFGK